MKKQHYNIGEPLQDIGLVSIVVPIYNSAKFLDLSLQSLINQTYPYWQAILVNDGSTDNSLEILYKFAKKDKRFFVIDKQNGGVSSARNAGLEKATGEYVVFFDPDDMLYPQFLEIMLKALKDNDSDFVWCKMKNCMEADNLSFCQRYERYTLMNLKNPLEKLILKHKPRVPISVIGKIFKREILQNKWFDCGFRQMAEDFNFSLNLFQYVGKVTYVKNHLLAYRQNSASLTHQPLSAQAIDDHIRLLRFAVWRFKDSLARRLRFKLWAKLSKIVFKYCCIVPYMQSENYLWYWKKYNAVCQTLMLEKTFFPYKLSFFYCTLCWLFLHKKWKLLAVILAFHKNFKKITARKLQ